MTKMEVQDVLNSVSAVGMQDIIPREGRWRVEFHNSNGSEFFTKMVEDKLKIRGTVLRVLPRLLSYSVDQVLDQLEKYAILVRQKAQDAKEFGGKVSAVSKKGLRCAYPWARTSEQRPTRRQITGGSSQISRQFRAKGKEKAVKKEISKRWSTVSGQATKEKRRRTVPTQEQILGAEKLLAARWTSKRLKMDKIWWKIRLKRRKRRRKFGNQDAPQVNGNPLHTETPANKIFGKGKDSRSRGKGKSNEFNPHCNTFNIKGQGGTKRGAGISIHGGARGKGVNAVEAGEE